MSTGLHEFNKSLKTGQRYERVLDKVFSDRYSITPVSMDLQRLGIDRIFTSIKSRKRFSVEYKGDEKTQTTGNAFIETVSVDTDNKPGWAITSCAQILIYYVIGPNDIYISYMTEIKRLVSDWANKYEEKPAYNEGYKTLGLCVPIEEIEPISRVIRGATP